MKIFGLHRVEFRSLAPEISSDMSVFYHGVSRSELPFARWAHYENPEEADTLELIINTYHCPKLIFPESRLVVREDLALQILRVGRVKLKPVKIVGAYRIPYQAGNAMYKHVEGWNRDDPDSDHLVRELAVLHACDIPKINYFQILVRHPDFAPLPPRYQELIVNRPDGDGWGDRTYKVPLAEVDWCGIIHCREYFCNEVVFRVLEPYIEYPFVLSHEFDV